MPDPIDYFSHITPPDPNAFINGVNMVNAPIVARQTQQFHGLQLQAAQQQAEQAQRYQADAEAVLSNPTPDGFRNLMVRYPAQHEPLKQAWDQYSDGEKRRNSEAAANVYAALSNGKPDLALTTLKARQQALKGAGEDTTQTDALIEMLESGDQQQINRAKGIAGMVLAVSAGPEKIGSTLEALSNSGAAGPKEYVVGRGIGHLGDDGKWVLDYRDPDAPQYRELEVIGPDGLPHKSIVAVGGDGQPASGGNVSPKMGAVASTLGGHLPAPVVAGFMGNFHVEGGYDGAQGDGGSASGIAQLRGERRDNFTRMFGQEPHDASPEDQAKFVLWEMEHPQAAGMTVAQRDAILAAKTPQQAAALIDKYYERSSGRDRSVRMSAANAFANGAAPAGAPRVVAMGAPTGKPGETGVDLPGNTNLTGDAYLKTVPQNLATQVKALSEGRLALPASFALTKPYWQKLLQMTAQYDPTFDAANAKTRVKTRLEFTSGKAAANITSFNTVLGHLDSLDKSVGDLHNTRFPSYNALANWIGTSAGDTRLQTALKTFNANRNAVARELTRAFRQSGGNVADIKDFEHDLNAADSPQALHGVIAKYVDLLASRVNALGEQYDAGMGRSSDPINLLDPHARQTMKRLMGESGGEGGQLPAGAKLLGRSKKTGRNVYLVDGKQVYGP